MLRLLLLVFLQAFLLRDVSPLGEWTRPEWTLWALLLIPPKPVPSSSSAWVLRWVSLWILPSVPTANIWSQARYWVAYCLQYTAFLLPAKGMKSATTPF